MGKGLREEMPGVAALVDELRAVFGRDLVDRQIRSGMAGQGGFLAQETGPDGQVRQVGSGADKAPRVVVTRRSWGYLA